MSKPHLCFVAPNLYPLIAGDTSIPVVGGAEVQQSFIIAGLKRLGYPITVLTNDFGQNDGVEINGVTVRTIPSNRGRLPFIRFFHPGMTSLMARMKEIDADIYYQRNAGWVTGALGWFSARHGKKFVYAAAHDLDMNKGRTREIFNYPLGWRALWLYRAGVKRSRAVVVQNPRQQADSRSWLKQPTHLIRSCYQPPGVFEPAQHGGAVLWVAILRPWKRPELFLELARRLPHIPFILAGGPDQGEMGMAFYRDMEKQASSLPNVRFAGFLPYRKADVLFNGISLFVNTSEHEGFPNTFLQAWARGAPTVSFFDTGARDAQGNIGKVVEDMEAMTAAIQQYHDEPDLWQQAGQRSLEYYRSHHHMDAIVGQYDQLFTELMSGSSGHH